MIEPDAPRRAIERLAVGQGESVVTRFEHMPRQFEGGGIRHFEPVETACVFEQCDVAAPSNVFDDLLRSTDHGRGLGNVPSQKRVQFGGEPCRVAVQAADHSASAGVNARIVTAWTAPD